MSNSTLTGYNPNRFLDLDMGMATAKQYCTCLFVPASGMLLHEC